MSRDRRRLCHCSVGARRDMPESFARADRLDVLRDPLVGRRCWTQAGVAACQLAGACRQGKLTPAGTGTLIDALRATGHRLPCTGAGFPSYARQHGLL